MINVQQALMQGQVPPQQMAQAMAPTTANPGGTPPPAFPLEEGVGTLITVLTRFAAEANAKGFPDWANEAEAQKVRWTRKLLKEREKLNSAYEQMQGAKLMGQM